MARSTKKKPVRRRRKKTVAPKPAPTLVSPAAFADSLGVSRAAVRKAMDVGRLVDSVTEKKVGSRLYRKIDLEAGRAEWARNTAPRNETGAFTLSMDPEDLDAGPRRLPRLEGADEEPINLAAERARKERALADRQELTVATLQAALMERDEAARAIEGIARGVREKLAGFAAELPDELHMRPRKQVAIVLERATAEVCAELSSLFQELFTESMRRGA